MRPRELTIYVVLLAALALPVQAAGQPEQLKSAEDIVKGLLGIGDSHGTKSSHRDEKPSIAVPIQFEYNSATITAESFAQLQMVAEALKSDRLSKSHFRVEGHTDSSGSEAFNRTLSERRAEAVKSYLVDKLGVDAAQLDAKGLGKDRPLEGVSQDTEEGRALNRRVVFVNLDAGGREPGPASASTDLAVEVVVKYQKGGDVGVLAPGGVLTPDDNYRVTFTATRPGYVYAFQIDSSGKIDPIFPNPSYSPAGNPVTARRIYSVPPEGQWLTLDETQGHEEIIVLASQTELHDPKAVALDLRSRAGGSPQEVASLPRGGRATGLFSYRLGFEHR